MKRLSPVLAVALLTAPVNLAARSALTPARYRARATAICVLAQQEVTALPSLEEPQAGVRFFASARPIERSCVAALGALQPPAELRRLHAGFVSDETKQLALTTRFLHLAGRRGAGARGRR